MYISLVWAFFCKMTNRINWLLNAGNNFIMVQYTERLVDTLYVVEGLRCFWYSTLIYCYYSAHRLIIIVSSYER
jgi:hypothetical protein